MISIYGHALRTLYIIARTLNGILLLFVRVQKLGYFWENVAAFVWRDRRYAMRTAAAHTTLKSCNVFFSSFLLSQGIPAVFIAVQSTIYDVVLIRVKPLEKYIPSHQWNYICT